jgi:hypothetical protein
VVGQNSSANALEGNRNRAVVVGNQSIANAGFRVEDTTNTPGNRNRATVVGNSSVAEAGPGDGNRVRVVGNNKTDRKP